MSGERGTVGAEIAAVLGAAIDAAEASGILPHGGIYGTLSMPDPVHGACCDGSAVKGPQYCTCWEPVFDMDQADPMPGEPGTRSALCPDCAYRPGSPERSGDERYNGDAAFLDRITVTGERFFCHQGIRRTVRLVHPSGAEIEAPPGDYRPPIVGGVPYKADGSPGDLCAGWAARRLKHMYREAASVMTPDSPEDSQAGSTPPPGLGADGALVEPASPAPARPAPDGSVDPRPPVRGTTGPSPSPGGDGPAPSSPLLPLREGDGDGGTREEAPGMLRPAGTSPAQDAPGAVSPPAAAPGGSSGQEWRDRVKAATSAVHAAQRNERGRYTRKTPGQRFGPGMARRMPEPPPEDAA